MLKLSKCSKEQFEAAISSEKNDSFAKTFIAKANMQELWDLCYGAFDGDTLLAAIITTHGKRNPKIANLQLLHTFAAHRGKGAARLLCIHSLKFAKVSGCQYYRVSSEIPSVGFYEKLGFKFWGKQKSGCQLSIFKITSDKFEECEYNHNDSIIQAAVYRKGKGGCVEVFDSMLPDLDISEMI